MVCRLLGAFFKSIRAMNTERHRTVCHFLIRNFSGADVRAIAYMLEGKVENSRQSQKRRMLIPLTLLTKSGRKWRLQKFQVKVFIKYGNNFDEIELTLEGNYHQFRIIVLCS